MAKWPHPDTFTASSCWTAGTSREGKQNSNNTLFLKRKMSSVAEYCWFHSVNKVALALITKANEHSSGTMKSWRADLPRCFLDQRSYKAQMPPLSGTELHSGRYTFKCFFWMLVSTVVYVTPATCHSIWYLPRTSTGVIHTRCEQWISLSAPDTGVPTETMVFQFIWLHFNQLLHTIHTNKRFTSGLTHYRTKNTQNSKYSVVKMNTSAVKLYFTTSADMPLFQIN